VSVSEIESPDARFTVEPDILKVSTAVSTLLRRFIAGTIEQAVTVRAPQTVPHR